MKEKFNKNKKEKIMNEYDSYQDEVSTKKKGNLFTIIGVVIGVVFLFMMLTQMNGLAEEVSVTADVQDDKLQGLIQDYLDHKKALSEYLDGFGLTIKDLDIEKVSSARTSGSAEETPEDFTTTQ